MLLVDILEMSTLDDTKINVWDCELNDGEEIIHQVEISELLEENPDCLWRNVTSWDLDAITHELTFNIM